MTQTKPSLTIPDYGQHALLIGSTGSGKSVLGEEMLKHVSSYFIFDTQNCIDLKGAKICTKPSDAISAIKKNIPKIIYKPKMKYHIKEINGYILETLSDSSSKKRKRPRVVYIDEIFHLGYMQSFPTQLPVSMATNRQKAISMWISTQRPKLIPSNLMTEASVIYLFRLTKRDDIKYIAENIKDEPKDFINVVQNMKKDEYKFIKIDLTEGTYNIYPPVKIN